MSNNLTLAMILSFRNSDFVRGLDASQRQVSKFTAGAQREIEALKGAFGSITGKLATLGVGFSATQQIMQSARLDKGLIQIGQTAGESSAQVARLRGELFAMAKQTGRPVEELQEGFNNLVQSGQNWSEALETIKAVNIGSAVSGAKADVLSGGLTVASTAYQFDLAKPGKALELLDKMTVAGRLGNAELNNLADIFARVGVNAAGAGMGFDKTLGFIETLSLIERQPERLATLADSTLRLFNNLNYAKEASKATGVKFFDEKGGRRDPLAVLADMKNKYDALSTDKDRALFIQKAFGKADLDTIKGLKTLLSGDMLSKVSDFEHQISGAGGALNKDLPNAIDNAVDQVGRLKSALRQAADDFSKPINATLSNAIKWSMDKKENGGLELSGGQMMGGAAALTLGTLGAARYGGKLIGKVAGVGGGVAAGKALEAAAGVTPVFVTNWPGGGVGGGAAGTAAEVAAAATGGGMLSKLKTTAALLMGSRLSALPMMGAGAMGTAGLAVAGAGAAGYGAGTLLNSGLSALMSKIMGREESIGTLIYEMTHKEVPVKVTVDVKNGNIVAGVNEANTRQSRRG